MEREKEEKQAGKKGGREEAIEEKVTNISYIRPKNTVFDINQSKGRFGQMSALQG